MEEQECWPNIRGAPDPSAGGRLPDARLAQRGRRRRAGGLAAAQPRRRERDREPRRLADDGRRARLPRHAALAQVAARGAARYTCPTRSSSRRRHRTRARGGAGRLGRLALLVVLETLAPAGAARVRPARHVRRAVRRDRADRRALADAARQLASRARRRVQGERRRPTPTWPASGRSSTRSWRPRATVISRRWSRCSIPTSCCEQTRGPCRSAHPTGPRRRDGRQPGARLRAPGPFIEPALINGVVGAVTTPDGKPFSVGAFTVEGHKDRRNRHPGRPGTTEPARPDGSGPLTLIQTGAMSTSIRCGPGSASARPRASTSVSPESARRAGTPEPVAISARSRSGPLSLAVPRLSVPLAQHPHGASSIFRIP